MEEANLLFKKGEKVAKLFAFVLFALSALKGIVAVISGNIALLANIAFYSHGCVSNQSFGISDFDVCFSFHYSCVENCFQEQALPSVEHRNGFCRNSCCNHTLSDWRHSAIDNPLRDNWLDDEKQNHMAVGLRMKKL